MSSLTPDQLLLHYRLLGKIGERGMGEVYKAEDSRLGGYVAIKLLSPETAQNEKAKQRLLREARSDSALNHPNIVVIHAIEAAEGSDFIVMEYVEGETLKAMIGRGCSTWARKWPRPSLPATTARSAVSIRVPVPATDALEIITSRRSSHLHILGLTRRRSYP
jgi:serine/threonine protein kinase